MIKKNMPVITLEASEGACNGATMIYYAIQHINGGFLHGKNKGGYTNAEPLPMNEAPPRLFFSQQYAKRSLTEWLAGKQRLHRSHGYSYYYYEYEYDEWVDLTPVPSRKAEEMAVVKMKLSFEQIEAAHRYYVLVDKKTDHVLPARRRKVEAYDPWPEPLDASVPRLFERRSDAQNALNKWFRHGRREWFRLTTDDELFPKPIIDDPNEELVVDDFAREQFLWKKENYHMVVAQVFLEKA